MAELEVIPAVLPCWSHYFVACGPMLSTLIMTWVGEGRDGLKSLWSRIIKWRVGLFAGAIVFTWLFHSTGGSILVVAVWHAAFNFITASSAGEGIIAAAVTTVVTVWAVLVVLIFKLRNLSHKSRVEA